jgi:hypothetical protein
VSSLTRTLYPLLDPGEPLRKRVPIRDEDGQPLSDFMMLFPGLRDQPQHRIEEVVVAIQGVLAHFDHAVMFAELNIRLNLLFVSVRPITGLPFEFADAIQCLVPDAKLVCHV